MTLSTVIPLQKELPSWKPRGYMKTGVKLMVSQACAGLLIDPGMGKTSISLMSFKILFEQKYVKKVLVISTKKGIYNSWGGDNGEIEKWADFADLRWTILHGDDKNEALNCDADVFLINPAGLKWLLNARYEGKKLVVDTKKLKQIGVDMLIVDESTDFKNASSERFKMLSKVLGFFKRRYILTGTPDPNGLIDLFGQIYILDEGTALGRFITHYRMNYFYQSGFGGYTWLPNHDALDRISKRISPLVLRMEAKDYLDLPELVENKVYIDLPPAARKMYQTLEDDLIISLENEEITAANQAVASGKCRQLVAGGLYCTDVLGKRGHTVIHDEKIKALKDLVSELGGAPLLVFYEFNFEQEMLMSAFSEARALGKSDKKDQEYIAAFNEGKLPMLLGQPSSASKSINLQRSCNHVCWFSQTWKADDHRQGIDRVRRQGNKASHVMVHYILARDTIDEVIFKRIIKKDSNSSSLAAELKKLRKR